MSASLWSKVVVLVFLVLSSQTDPSAGWRRRRTSPTPPPPPPQPKCLCTTQDVLCKITINGDGIPREDCSVRCPLSDCPPMHCPAVSNSCNGGVCEHYCQPE